MPLDVTADEVERPFACPWCGARFETRFVISGLASLEGHWLDRPECSANRAVNNPTNSKHDVIAPEFGLRLVDRLDRDA